jgi:uncharacterized membrane protein YbaN (DUF454 family)
MRKLRSGIHYLLIIIFLGLGFIGLALPIVPQAIFFLIAIIIISFEFPKFSDYIESKMDKESQMYRIYHTHRKKFEKYFK